MRKIHRDFVPADATIVKGERGGEYMITPAGEKVRITSQTRKPPRCFKAKRGAFLRFIEAQNEVN